MSIQEQIEALTQELRPYPRELFQQDVDTCFYYFDGIQIIPSVNMGVWYEAMFASTNKAEVEEYADCYRRLKLYQLLGKKAEKEFPLFWSDVIHYKAFKIGTDFRCEPYHETGMATIGAKYRPCVLGGVWFARNEDRLEALEICGIDKAFQEKCAKHGLGGA